MRKSDERCFYCRRQIVRIVRQCTLKATIDHVIPKSKKGSNHRSNLVAACYFCNTTRGDMDAQEFFAIIQIAVQFNVRMEIGGNSSRQFFRLIRLIKAELEDEL